MAKYFLNRKLNSLNTLEVEFSPKLLSELQLIYNTLPSLVKPDQFSSDDFALLSPSKWGSDIKWISNNSLNGYKLFLKTFQALGIPNYMKQIIDYEKKLILYMGQFITRSESNSEHFHYDWSKIMQNNAFTFLTPIFHIDDGLDLFYRDLDGKTRIYKYQLGKAIIFGSEFKHSTALGKSSEPSTILSLQFGTDIPGYTSQVLKEMGTQSLFYRLPDGNFYRKRS